MPYPNEHAARIHEPGKYSRLRRVNDAFGKGIHAIYGRRKSDGKSEVQSIRFDRKKFTPAQARKWLKDHDYTSYTFEAAKPVKKAYKTPQWVGDIRRE